ncbi:MAG: hypothetical protein NC548_27355 [Lachnospiraceae bacterium]|nr:hypothetical protein [Lachnospiraceae bacterium]
MADIVKDDDLDLDDIDDKLDNDEGYDLDGDSDEDIDTDIDDEETDDAETDEDGEDELDDTDTDENDDEDDEADAEDDKEGEKPNDGNAPEEPVVDAKDAEIEELRKQLAEKDTALSNVRNLSRETLQKMGVKVDGTVEEALEKANAESEGVSLEDYRKARAATAEAQAAEAQAKKQAFEQLAASDLSELKKSFPDLLNHKHISECFDNMTDFVQFGKLRDSGVEPKTAYLAVNGDKVRTKQAAAAQQKAANGGKQHLNSAVTKKASGDTVVMSKETMREWQDMFPHLSKAEIKALYKQSL